MPIAVASLAIFDVEHISAGFLRVDARGSVLDIVLHGGEEKVRISVHGQDEAYLRAVATLLESPAATLTELTMLRAANRRVSDDLDAARQELAAIYRLSARALVPVAQEVRQ